MDNLSDSGAIVYELLVKWLFDDSDYKTLHPNVIIKEINLRCFEYKVDSWDCEAIHNVISEQYFRT